MKAKQSNYYIDPSAISITPNHNGNAQYVYTYIASGTTVQVLWQKAGDCVYDEGSELASLNEKAKDDLYRSIYSMLTYASDNVSYRRFALDGKCTVLSDGHRADRYNIYIRLSPDNTAIIIYSYQDEPDVSFTVTKDEDGNITSAEIEYAWIKIGELSATDQSATVGRVLTGIYTGYLGTDRNVDEKVSEIEESLWFESDTEKHIATMKEGSSEGVDFQWLFRGFRALSLYLKGKRSDNTEDGADKTQEAVVDDTSDVTSGETQEATQDDTQWYTVDGILVDIDEISNDAVADKQHNLVTGGFLFAPFYKWLRSKFIFKTKIDGDGDSQSINTSLTATKLVSESSVESKTVTASGEIHGKDIKADNNVTASNDVIASQNVKGKNVEASANVKSPVFQTSKYQPGDLTGTGAAVYDGNDGSSHIESDYMSIRKAAWFRTVTIEEVKHVGGEMILSQAACQIGRVEQGGGIGPNGNLLPMRPGATSPGVYRCYFPTEANGKKQYNEWAVGDQARCQVCNLSAGTSENVATKYYWRLVVGVHTATEDETEHWVDLSNTDYDGMGGTTVTGTSVKLAESYTSAPEPDDNIVLLGSRSGVGSRTTAQVYSTAEANAPSRRYYHGITDYNLNSNKSVETMEWDNQIDGVHWRVGDSETFMDFTSKDGLQIQASKINFGAEKKSIADVIAEQDEKINSGISIHAAGENDPTLPLPNNMEDGDAQPYLDKGYDTFTQGLATVGGTYSEDNLQSFLGDYYITTSGLVFFLSDTIYTGMTSKYVWEVITDQYLIQAIKDAQGAYELANSASIEAKQAMDIVKKISVDQTLSSSEIGDINITMSQIDSDVATAANIVDNYNSSVLTASFLSHICSKDSDVHISRHYIAPGTDGYYNSDGSPYHDSNAYDWFQTHDERYYTPQTEEEGSYLVINPSPNYSTANINGKYDQLKIYINDLLFAVEKSQSKSTHIDKSEFVRRFQEYYNAYSTWEKAYAQLQKQSFDESVTILNNIASDNVATSQEVSEIKRLKLEIEKEYFQTERQHNMYLWDSDLMAEGGPWKSYESRYNTIIKYFGRIISVVASNGIYTFSEAGQATDSDPDRAGFDNAYTGYLLSYNYLRAQFDSLSKRFLDMTFGEKLHAIIYDGYIYNIELPTVVSLNSIIDYDDQEVQNAWKSIGGDEDGLGEYRTLYNNYVTAKSALKAFLNNIINVLPWKGSRGESISKNGIDKSEATAIINNYINTRATFLTSNANYFFAQNRFYTKLGNYFEYETKDGEQVLKVRDESGLLTTATEATLYSQRVQGGDIISKATVGTYIEDGVSKVKISADQINIDGQTNIKGIVVREPKFITSLNMDAQFELMSDPYLTSYYYWAESPNAASGITPKGMVLSLDKISATTYIYGKNAERDDSQWPGGYDGINPSYPDGLYADETVPGLHILLPHYMKGVLNVSSARGDIFENNEDSDWWHRLAVWYGKDTTTGDVKTWSEDFKYFVRKSRGQKILMARKYIGTEIQLIIIDSGNNEGVFLHGISNVDMLNSNDYNVTYYAYKGGDITESKSDDQEHGILYIPSLGNTGKIIVVSLTCVEAKESSNSLMEGVQWHATVRLDDYTDKYIMGIDDAPSPAEE